MGLPLVLCWAMPLEACGGSPGDVTVVAMSEDGEHLYSSVIARRFWPGFPRADAVLTRLARRYPDGYQIEVVSDAESDPRIRLAVERNRKRGEDGVVAYECH